jgi:phosphate-selective porin OprO and OprP
MKKLNWHRFETPIRLHATLCGALALSALSAAAFAEPERLAQADVSVETLLHRLDTLEARIQSLEAQNLALAARLQQDNARVAQVTERVAKAAQVAPAPIFADVDDNFSFKARGTLQADVAQYGTRAGGYDFNNGTDVRRARFGFDGMAYHDFRWRAEAEYVKNTANLLDLYVQYGLTPSWTLTLGQHKTPFGLEANSFDGFNTFLERGMANNAFGAVGAERRVGISAAFQSNQLNASFGLFGAGEAVTRNALTPGEGYSVNARISWDPVLAPGAIVHLGWSGYQARGFAANSLTVGDRPNVRVDDARLISATIAGSAADLAQTGAKSAYFSGAEALWVRGALSLQGEYGVLGISRFGAAPTVNFDGGYVFASWFATGESRAMRNGVMDRVRPLRNFEPAHDAWGALEFAWRFDTLDLSDFGLSPLQRQARNWTAAANWYLNPNTKIIFNYIRFLGTNSPLTAAPIADNGTTAKGTALAARVQFDF